MGKLSAKEFKIAYKKGKRNFSNYAIYNADLRNIDLTDANFYYCSFYDADFRNTRLSGAKFNGCYLRDANFSGVDVTGVSFFQSDISNANFYDAIICNTDFRMTVITDIKICCPRTNSDFSGAKIESQFDINFVALPPVLSDAMDKSGLSLIDLAEILKSPSFVKLVQIVSKLTEGQSNENY